MKASILDLRYKMKEVLDALNKKEKVTILYHGKVKGTIIPHGHDTGCKVQEHPFFGMKINNEMDVLEELDSLRGGRFNDI